MNRRQLQIEFEALRRVVMEMIQNVEDGQAVGISLEQYAALVGRAPSTIKKLLSEQVRAEEAGHFDPVAARRLPTFTFPEFGDPYITLEHLREHQAEVCRKVGIDRSREMEERYMRAVG